MPEPLTAFLLSCATVVAWAVGILGLPGNWIIVGIAGACWWLVEPSSRLAVSTAVLVTLILFAVVGELIEFAAGALGVQRLGGSRRSTWLALLGSIMGAIVGFVVGSGVPIIGNVIASVVGSALGAFVGSIYGERSLGKPWEHSLQVGSAAFFGRVLGTAAKMFCGTVIALIFLAALWI
jgi:uncharacterized protein